ncbi:hypothetical protein I4U23_025918 [Adineta vaga]|nr:hypothetical protein I4U23_025918 [Adineta vaga]
MDKNVIGLMEKTSSKPDTSEKLRKLKNDYKTNNRSKQQDLNLFNCLNDEKENLEDCLIIWLDVQYRARYHHIEKLRNIVNYLKIFDNIDDCMQYICTIENERIFLVVSGQVGKQVVPLLHHLDQLYSIYIFCLNIEAHKVWSMEYPKIRGVFIDEKLLYNNLHDDVYLCLSQLPMNIITLEQTSHSLDSTEKPSFFWSQILLQVLVRLPESNSAKQDMITEARDQYKNNLIEQSNINEFERSYSRDAALKWYTRDSFVYRLVNKALRTENIDNIFLYRFFIIDLYKQLRHMHLQFISSAKSSTLTFYRGQLVSTTEFQKIKSSVNQYISINTFFSTSKSSEIAVEFFSGGSLRPIAESVLFEIIVDISVQTQPFADIQKWSTNQNEEEVLFSMGTIFKIESCEQFNDDFWHVVLSLSSEQDEQIQYLLNDYYNRIGETTSLLILGEYLHKIHELDKAERYYKLLIQELPVDHLDVGMAFNNIGTIYTDRGQYKIAKAYLRKAMKIFRKTLPARHLNIAEVYLNLGSVLSHMDAGKVALKYERKALDIQMKLLPSYHLTLATTYNNIGDTYSSLNKRKKAVKNFEKALEIELNHLPNNHPDIAVTYNNLASVYFDMHDHKNALKYSNKALEVRIKTLPPSHPDIADTYRMMGSISDEADQTTDAIDKYYKSLKVLLDKPIHNLDHYRISQIYTDLGLLYIKRHLSRLALKCFKKCLYHLRQCEFRDYYNISIVYNNLATAYSDIEQYKKAIIYCRKSLKIQHRYKNPLKFKASFITHTIRATIFRAKKQHKKALCILKDLAKRQCLLLPECGEQLFETYKEMALNYGDQNQFKASEKYFKKSIQFHKLFSPESKIEIAFTYCQIGTLYANKEMSQKAIKWYKKAVAIYLKAEPSPSIDLGEAYYLLGEEFFRIKQYSKANTFLKNARNLFTSNLSSNDVRIAKTYTKLGILKGFQKRFKISNKYYKLALNIHQQQKKSNFDVLIKLHSFLGASFSSLGNITKAMYHCNRVLEIAQQNSLLSNENEETNIVLANVYCNIGQTYLENNKLNKALKSLKKSLTIFRRYSNPVHHISLSRVLIFIGSVHRRKEYHKRALFYLREARNIFRQDVDIQENELLPILYNEIGLCCHYIGDRQHRIAYSFYKRASNTSSTYVSDNFQQTVKQNMKYLKKQMPDNSRES